LAEYLTVTRDALDIGLAGVTYGRFVWQDKNPAAVIRALAALIHDNASVEQALSVYEQLS
jgi:DhnA family fructose-bisphosphate aldolase class Ia